MDGNIPITYFSKNPRICICISETHTHHLHLRISLCVQQQTCTCTSKSNTHHLSLFTNFSKTQSLDFDKFNTWATMLNIFLLHEVLKLYTEVALRKFNQQEICKLVLTIDTPALMIIDYRYWYQCHHLSGNWHRIYMKMNPTMWHLCKLRVC